MLVVGLVTALVTAALLRADLVARGARDPAEAHEDLAEVESESAVATEQAVEAAEGGAVAVTPVPLAMTVPLLVLAVPTVLGGLLLLWPVVPGTVHLGVATAVLGAVLAVGGVLATFALAGRVGDPASVLPAAADPGAGRRVRGGRRAAPAGRPAGARAGPAGRRRRPGRRRRLRPRVRDVQPMGRDRVAPHADRRQHRLPDLVGRRRPGGRRGGGGAAMSDLLLLVVGLPLLVALRPAVRAPARSASRSPPPPASSTSAVVLLFSLLMLAARPWQGPAAGAGGRLAVDPDARRPAAPRASTAISWPLIVLTAALGLAVTVHATLQSPVASAEAVASGESAPTGSMRSLVVALLAVEGGALATFTAADVVLFFVAFEIVLVPMWAIIRWWGDPHDDAGRRDAASALRAVHRARLGGDAAGHPAAGAGQRARATSCRLAAAHGTGMTRPEQVVVAALLVAGLAVKVPVWPLHTWLPSAHTVAPTVGSVLLAGVLLKMGSYGMVRIVVPTVPQGFSVVAPYLGALGVVGILWGGLVCLVERDLKRLVAFSSVAHMGFVALGIASGTPQGLQGALFANVAHGVITALLFLVAGGAEGTVRQRVARPGRLRPARRAPAPRRAAGPRLHRRARAARAGRLLGRAARRVRGLDRPDRRQRDLLADARGARRRRHRAGRGLPAAGPAQGLARRPGELPLRPNRSR